eukprot:scaffold49_cov409-Prasinococcus_capsulatus_cf.AAC.21
MQWSRRGLREGRPMRTDRAARIEGERRPTAGETQSNAPASGPRLPRQLPRVSAPCSASHLKYPPGGGSAAQTCTVSASMHGA